MKFMNTILILILSLSLSCSKEDSKKQNNHGPAIKKDELVVRLSTNEKLESKSKILSILKLEDLKEDQIDFLIKSYPKTALSEQW